MVFIFIIYGGKGSYLFGNYTFHAREFA
jgi:hypothetical protein